MTTTHTIVPSIDRAWSVSLRRVMHPGYRLILRWCDHLDFEDVLRIDHASIERAMDDPNRNIGPWWIVFGDGHLPMTIVREGLLNTTTQYITDSERENESPKSPKALLFTEVDGETVTRTSISAAIHRAITLLRLSRMFRY